MCLYVFFVFFAKNTAKNTAIYSGGAKNTAKITAIFSGVTKNTAKNCGKNTAIFSGCSKNTAKNTAKITAKITANKVMAPICLHLHLHRMLALTGLRVKGREVAGLGLASHYCSSSLLPSLRREVEECGVGEVGEVLEHFTRESGGRGEEEVAGMVEAWREVSVAGDLAATLGRSEEVLPKQAALLAAAAPLSLAVADRLLGQAEEESYAQALLTAYTVAGNIYFLPEMIKGAGQERVWSVGEGWIG